MSLMVCAMRMYLTPSLKPQTESIKPCIVMSSAQWVRVVRVRQKRMGCTHVAWILHMRPISPSDGGFAHEAKQLTSRLRSSTIRIGRRGLSDKRRLPVCGSASPGRCRRRSNSPVSAIRPRSHTWTAGNVARSRRMDATRQTATSRIHVRPYLPSPVVDHHRAGAHRSHRDRPGPSCS